MMFFGNGGGLWSCYLVVIRGCFECDFGGESGGDEDNYLLLLLVAWASIVEVFFLFCFVFFVYGRTRTRGSVLVLDCLYRQELGFGVSC